MLLSRTTVAVAVGVAAVAAYLAATRRKASAAPATSGTHDAAAAAAATNAASKAHAAAAGGGGGRGWAAMKPALPTPPAGETVPYDDRTVLPRWLGSRFDAHDKAAAAAAASPAGTPHEASASVRAHARAIETKKEEGTAAPLPRC